MRLKDGNTMRVASRPNVVLAAPPLPLPNGVRPISGILPLGVGGGSSILRLTRRQLDSIHVGIASVAMDVWTKSARPSVLTDLPLAVGASARRDGQMVRVHAVGRLVNEDSLASVSITTIEKFGHTVPMWSLVFAHQMPRYAIINPTRNEAVVPFQGGSGGATTSLVLPGVQRRTFATSFDWSAINGGAPTPHVDLEWLRDARVLVFAWTPLGSEYTTIDNVPVDIEAPPTASERRSPASETFPASHSPRTRSP
jgi:hypothetical protein